MERTHVHDSDRRLIPWNSLMHRTHVHTHHTNQDIQIAARQALLTWDFTDSEQFPNPVSAICQLYSIAQGYSVPDELMYDYMNAEQYGSETTEQDALAYWLCDCVACEPDDEETTRLAQLLSHNALTMYN